MDPLLWFQMHNRHKREARRNATMFDKPGKIAHDWHARMAKAEEYHRQNAMAYLTMHRQSLDYRSRRAA